MANLIQPLRMKGLVLSNRLVLPPMATEKSQGRGSVSQALLDYYAEKTAGGYFGFVVLEHSYIDEKGQASVGQVSFSRDEDVEGLSNLAALIHRSGSRVIAQINHAGGKSISALGGGLSLAPSAMSYTTTRGEAIEARSMTQDDIDDVIAGFAAAARRSKKAGFDGVEIHSAHGYLLNQFYSPLTNRRTDAYSGGSIESRTLIHRQIIAAVREAVGPDFLVALRIGALDYEEGGSTVEDAVSACRLFEQAGVDLIDVSGGLCGYRGSGSREEGYFKGEAHAIRDAVSVPVVLTGGVRTPAGAQALLDEGDADLVGVGRAVLKDSLWAKNAIEGVGGAPIAGTVFLDYDGTLHDSMASYGPAFRRAYAWLVEEGYKQPREFSDEWISQWLGFTTEQMWMSFAPDLPEEVWRHAARIVGETMDQCAEDGQARLFTGVPEMLSDLRSRGYRLVFLSNCRSDYCEVHRRVFGLDRWFDTYCCAEDFGDIPKWAIYQRVADGFARPQVMVGDRFHDGEVAKRAGIPFVACAYGFGEQGEWLDADAVALGPQEVADCIDSLLVH